jgi:hypothetical protein
MEKDEDSVHWIALFGGVLVGFGQRLYALRSPPLLDSSFKFAHPWSDHRALREQKADEPRTVLGRPRTALGRPRTVLGSPGALCVVLPPKKINFMLPGRMIIDPRMFLGGQEQSQFEL